MLKFSYSGSKYGQQTFAISFKPLANQVDVFQEELALASLLLRFTNVQSTDSPPVVFITFVSEAGMPYI